MHSWLDIIYYLIGIYVDKIIEKKRKKLIYSVVDNYNL